jgi:hypothetical protein
MVAFKISGGSTIGILTMREAIASTAMANNVTYEEMEEKVFNHSSHT